MNRREMGRTIDAVEDVMLELEFADPADRAVVMDWLTNLRDDINSFLRQFGRGEEEE